MSDFVDALLDRFHARTPIRAGSLIVSLFGDAIVPRGGRLALSSLLDIMRAFRMSETLVRTAMSRLVAEGLFERRKVGRNTFYALSASGRQAFAAAAKKIYGAPAAHWDGLFDLVLIDGANAERTQARAAWQERGFGTLTADLLLGLGAAGPSGKAASLHLRAQAPDAGTARRLAARAWPLRDLAARYARFNDMFAEAQARLERGEPLGGLASLVVRVLLVHEYRRVVLRDPLLPADLLPEDWPGSAARDMCKAIYPAVAPGADRWLDANAGNESGPLPPPGGTESRGFA
ncbi:MAG: phenylacetic acid degradation operon negative regulatory protein PaaX [Beijerinckiaceae bacterium]